MGMDFGNAVAFLKDGDRVARSGWNGKGMYLFRVAHWDGTGDTALNTCEHSPFIAMKTADNHVVPWLASQTDILAVDWEVVA